MTVSAESGTLPLHLVMDPGHWSIAITSDADILLVSNSYLVVYYHYCSLLSGLPGSVVALQFSVNRTTWCYYHLRTTKGRY